MPEQRLRIALALGGAECVWEDVAGAQDLGTSDAVFACNEAAVQWDNLTAFCTLHPENLTKWMKQRRDKGLPEPKHVIAHEERSLVTDVIWHLLPGQKQSASSGVYCAIAAMNLGYERVVLCGVPLTAGPHFFTNDSWRDLDQFVKGFDQIAALLQHHVRSMSGYTRERLGLPTREWLQG